MVPSDIGLPENTHTTHTGTKFGAVLDMVTDRCTTTLMMVQLANFWGERQGKKEWTFLFQFLIALDISSHWFHMYT